MKSARLRLKVVASVLVGVLVCPAFAQQPVDPNEQKKHKTRVCAIEDETQVSSTDNPTSSRELKPGYCIDCWAGTGCGAPFLAGGLLGLIGGSTGAAGAGIAGAAVVGGVLGGLAASGAFSNGGGGDGTPPQGPPGPPGGGFPPGPPSVIQPPQPLPTPPAVSPFQ